jgi:hypothetical protein
MGCFVTKIKICEITASVNEISNLMIVLGLQVAAVFKLHFSLIPRKEDLSVQLFENVTLSHVTKFLLPSYLVAHGVIKEKMDHTIIKLEAFGDNTVHWRICTIPENLETIPSP